MPNDADKNNDHHNPICRYVLHIQEHLALDWSVGYEGLMVTYTGTGESLLSGVISDQTALHGLLARIRDLNLTLISINPIANEDHSKRRIKPGSSKEDQEQ
jgi:hypothetical protein